MKSIAESILITVKDWIQNDLTFAWVVLVAILGAVMYDQISYISRKGNIPGPTIKGLATIAPLIATVRPKFEDLKEQWSRGPLSCVSILHKFLVFGSTRDIAWKALNSPKYLKLVLADNAVEILRPTSWFFLDSIAHARFRRSLNPLFTSEALKRYVPRIEEIYDKYLTQWVDHSKQHGSRKYLKEFRYLNCAVCLRLFCGSYIGDNQVWSISDNVDRVVGAIDLVSLPVIIPFTKAWYARKIADMIMNILADCAQKSKEKVAAGGSVDCVLDAWVESMLASRDGLGKSNEFTNKEISETVFVFFLAGLDTTSSGVTWLFQNLADRPAVMKKIRDEQLAIREGDSSRQVDSDMIDRMTYTEMVVKESLRYRPPLLMMAHEVTEDFPITKDYTVPKGSTFLPVFYPALHDPDVYDEPETFIPERWVKGSKASLSHKNWLVFGSGNHRCVGQNFVMLHLTLLIGKACMSYDWKHIITPQSDYIRAPTSIFPGDGCILEFSKRESTEIIG